MHKKLEEIITKTKEELKMRQQKRSLEDLKGKVFKHKVRDFFKTINHPKNGSIALITEIKLASPNENHLGDSADIESKAKQYEQGGADCISIVTEKYFFNGNPEFIKKAKQLIKLPVLQKDFVIDDYQLYEAKIARADAILLIARILSRKDLINLINLSIQLNIEPVVEINNENDLEKVLRCKTRIIAVNARDLDTFEVSVDKACDLIKKIPDKFIKLGFSGIKGPAEIEKYRNAGANGVLIGTSLMKAENIGEYIKSLHIHYDDISNTDVKVKICGIRSLEAAKVAVEAGADFLGFNFVPTSRRFIKPDDALKIIKSIIGQVKIVGVFQNADIEYLNDLARKLELDFVQLHGSENNDYINNVDIPIIKSVSLVDTLQKIPAKYFLLDRIKRGTGKMVDFEKAAKLASDFPLFYAGGLNPDNVLEVVRKVKPFAVDVAGGVETEGMQNLEKIRLFVKNAKGGY